VSELDLANLVGSIYDAGFGAGDWVDVGDRMSRVLGGHRSHIWIMEADGSRALVTRQNPDGIGPYLAHFQKLDPHLAFARESIANAKPRASAGRVDQEIIDERAYLKSEFYNDFGRHVGRRYMIGAYVAGPSSAIVAHLRDESQERFDQADARLDWFLPHLQLPPHPRDARCRLRPGSDPGWPHLSNARSPRRVHAPPPDHCCRQEA